MPLSNSEKQARFRKKEELKKFVLEVWEEAQLASFGHRFDPNTALVQLKQASELSSGWTDEDLEQSYKRVSQLRLDFITPRDDLRADIQEARNQKDPFLKSSNGSKWIDDTNQTVSEARALADHLIGAIELTRLSNAERAAAVIEALRHIGRAAANDPQLEVTDATTVSLAVLPTHYELPDWFLGALASWLAEQLTDEWKDEFAKMLLTDIGGEAQ